MLNRIAELTGKTRDALADPIHLEEVVADLWLSGVELMSRIEAPPTLVSPQVWIDGRCWKRSLVSSSDMAAWGHAPENGRTDAVARPDHPAIGVTFEQARAYASDHGGRLPRLAEWTASTARSAAGNHGLIWGVPSATGAFPAARSGLLDGWGNAWEWTAEGMVVGGSFASPPLPAPRDSAQLVGFRLIVEAAG